MDDLIRQWQILTGLSFAKAPRVLACRGVALLTGAVIDPVDGVDVFATAKDGAKENDLFLNGGCVVNRRQGWAFQRQLGEWRIIAGLRFGHNMSKLLM